MFPVKLRIYSNLIKKAKLYPTGVDLSIKDFETLFNSDTKVRGKNKELKIRLQRIESNAEAVAKELQSFTFELFEKKMFRSKDASINVAYHYQNKINSLNNNKQLSTASNYDLSLKSITRFIKAKTRTTIKNLTFYDVSADWLNKYESFMIDTEGKSRTTVSIYLRALRTIFNDAINENDIKREIYPFGKGKGKYQVPTSTRKKKALNKQQLATLFNAKPQSQEQEMAKDFWFFSYACNGMNIKDIALLKYENLSNDALFYYRAKTLNTKKGNLKEIKVFLNEYAKSIINKYGNKDKSELQVIFPVILMNDDVAEQQRKIKNFTSFVNLHFNKLASNEGFEFKISSYWARHSFATRSIQKGASMEFISEALNHSNLNVTKNYFAGFEDETKKQFANQLMDF
ncbi:tyrosine-type recombinase/integrase [Aquimarina celericrescens]|uniref:Tyrosine-type recombinase/integrase n=1 Tax=Aquimarina celericrescens TaxID=1964542 RepID=A0ABW5ARU9_9FLAO|nr:site-specific integrase [Aquimarina celericrescens]